MNNSKANLTKIDPKKQAESQVLSGQALSQGKESIINLIPFFPLDPERGKRFFLLKEFYDYVSSRFGIKRIEEGPGLSNNRFIKITGNRIRAINKEDVNSIITGYLIRTEFKSQINDIFRQWKKERTEDALMFLQEFKGEFLEDSKNESLAFFRNGFISIRKTGSEISLTFSEAFPPDRYIWETSLIKSKESGEREIKPVSPYFEDLRSLSLESIEKALSESEIFQFVRLISGLPRFESEENPPDLEARKRLTNYKQRFKAVCSSIGYLISGYKSESGNKAIIFLDEVIPEGNNREGRGGKSLISKFPLFWFGEDGRFVTLDGANRKKDDRFGFSQVNRETKIILLNDVPPNYEFNEVFNAVTKDGVKIELKKVNPFIKSDLKVIITSNKTIQGEGSSFRDRMHEIELSPYFSDDRKPKDIFGHEFFTKDWNPDQWNLFDWFMIYCLSVHLRDGLVKYEPINLKKRKLLNDPLFYREANKMEIDPQELADLFERELTRRVSSATQKEKFENVLTIPRTELVHLISDEFEKEEGKISASLRKSFIQFLKSKDLKAKTQGRRNQGRCYIIETDLSDLNLQTEENQEEDLNKLNDTENQDNNSLMF